MESLWRRSALALAKRTPVRPVRSKLTRPVASITFDDVPHSATRVGADVLEAAGLAGSFFVCGAHAGGRFEGQAQHTLADLRRLATAGHEIGCHGFAHADATRADLSALAADHARNQAFLEAAGAGGAQSFAYPFGRTSVRAKRFYSDRFRTCRGVLAGLNAGWIDLSELRAFLVTAGRFDARRIDRLAERARRRRGWLIFFTHDVGPEPSPFGCRREDLETLAQGLARAGIETLPVREAAKRVLEGDGSTS